MNCTEFRELIHSHLDGGSSAEQAASLHLHAEQCSSCAAFLASERRLRDALRTLPLPPPSPGFAARVLRAAAQQDPGGWRAIVAMPPAFALAAVLIVGLGALWWLPPGREAGPQPQAVPQPVPLRLVFHSPRALDGVTIRIELPPEVELAGHPGRRALSWQTDLQAGANLLELPVLVRRQGGTLTARLSYDGEQKQFSVAVEPPRPISLERPPQRAALLTYAPERGGLFPHPTTRSAGGAPSPASRARDGRRLPPAAGSWKGAPREPLLFDGGTVSCVILRALF